MKKRDYAGDLGALGYPKFSYLKDKKAPDPKELLFDAFGRFRPIRSAMPRWDQDGTRVSRGSSR